MPRPTGDAQHRTQNDNPLTTTNSLAGLLMLTLPTGLAAPIWLAIAAQPAPKKSCLRFLLAAPYQAVSAKKRSPLSSLADSAAHKWDTMCLTTASTVVVTVTDVASMLTAQYKAVFRTAACPTTSLMTWKKPRYVIADAPWWHAESSVNASPTVAVGDDAAIWHDGHTENA